MSNTDLIIEERSRDIGDFLVGRLIPFRKKRMVGPFIFIDHMGPSEVGPKKYMDVNQHPHIGLSTLTYLFEGSILHEDSMGTKQLIEPGSVNWMTAGRGVTHTERTPQELRDGTTHIVHGYQIWVALPKEKEESEPAFFHLDKNQIPEWKDDGTLFRLIAGKAFGKKSPLPVHSEMFMVEVLAENATELNLDGKLDGEVGICIVSGEIQACENTIKAGNLLVSKKENGCIIKVEKDSHLLLFGGKHFPEQRYIDWNFVSSDSETIAKAKKEWEEKIFPMMKDDDSYVPLPTPSPYKRKKP